MIERFFVVTQSGSIYEVSTEQREKGWPTVKKIAGSNDPKMPIGTCLNNGRLVGISDIGILMFDPVAKYGRDFEMMNTSAYGGGTSGPRALFLEREQAELGPRVSGRGLGEWDEQYRNETLAVLRAIGDDHPVFVIGRSVRRHFNLGAA